MSISSEAVEIHKEDDDNDSDDGNDEIEDNTDRPPQFGLTKYWDERYQKEIEPYEWFISWPAIKDSVGPIFEHLNDKILHIGCGNSPMSIDIEYMFKEIHNIDISGIVIDQMKAKYIDHQSQFWYQMDCSDLKFPDSQFDVVLDKATLDAISCGDNSRTSLIKSIIEFFRVLKIGGIFVEITCGLVQPDFADEFHGKRFQTKIIKSGKLRNPTNKDQIVHFFVFKKIGADFNENGSEDNLFLKNNDDDMLLQLCEEDLDL